jgi:hypothetical protein
VARLLAFALVIVASCSSTSSGGGGTRAVGGSAVKCTVGHNYATTQGVPADCLSCAMSGCGSVFDKAFGADPNSFGGVCASFLDCYCNTTDPNGVCDLNQTATCLQASNDISTCVKAMCANQCAGWF